MKSSTWLALKFALLIAALGLIVSYGPLLAWLATQDPATDFFLWYVLLGAWIATAYYLLFGEFISVKLDAAILLLYFALGTVLYWAASDAALQNAGLPSGGSIPAFLLASEDQLISEAFLALGVPIWLTIILTYAVVPAILIFIALALIAPNRSKSAVHAFFGGGLL